MQPTDFTVFGITLFLALVALLMWKRRRDKVAARMSEKLRGYIAVQEPAPNHEAAEVESTPESMTHVA